MPRATQVIRSRRTLLALLVVLITVGGATGVRASQTDCERWWKEYREALAHTPVVHRIRHVRHRLRRIVRMRLADLVPHRSASHPGRVLPARSRAKPTRAEILQALEFACGTLPDIRDGELLTLDQPVEFRPDTTVLGDSGRSEAASAGDLGIVGGSGSPLHDVSPTEAPIGSPIYGPISEPTGGSPAQGGVPESPAQPTRPTDPQTPSDPESPVPEPTTVVLLLTGVAGAAGLLKRRVL